MNFPDLSVALAAEVRRHHAALASWLADADQSAWDDFAGAHAPEFLLVSTDGSVHSWAELCSVVSAAGGHQPGFSISIDGVDAVAASDDIVVVRFVERHESGDEVSTRRSIAVLRWRADRADSARWIFVQETTLQTTGLETTGLETTGLETTGLETTGLEVSGEMIDIRPIGWVESPLVDTAAAPNQGDEGAPAAYLVIEPEMADGITDLSPGDEVIVLTWFDRARRDVLRLHPRGDVRNPVGGVFSTRSPDRPNPIGLHRVEIVSIDGLRVEVQPLEALDGTPVIDIKPILGPIDER